MSARRSISRLAREAFVQVVGRPTAGRRALPQLLVLGAQRAGTTSLWRWLCAHPQFVPPVLHMKGVHYHDLHADRSLWWYRGHFPLAARLARRDAVTGEANPYHLFHPRVPAHVAATVPGDARFVVLLRDPVERAVSHYHHMRLEGHEPLPSLEAALDAEPARLAGAEEELLADPRAVHRHHLHHGYVARGRYAEQLERWFAAVGRERVLVLSHDRLSSEPERVLDEVCRWARIDPARAPRPTSVHNRGNYPAPSAPTLGRLRATFAPHDERLWQLLGQRWW